MRETLFTFIIHCEPLFNQDPRYDETCGFASIFLAGPAFKADSYFVKWKCLTAFGSLETPLVSCGKMKVQYFNFEFGRF